MSVVRNTFLSQMIGCENPLPGSAVFHNTFFVSLHSAGRFLSFETPWLSGPRHCGQLDELAASPLEIRAASNDNRQMNEKDESLIASRFIDLCSPDQNLKPFAIARMGKTMEDTRDHGDKSSGAMIFHFLPSVR